MRRLILLALVGCDGGGAPPCEAPDAARVLPPAGWALAEAADDPFDDRPAEVACAPGGFGVEGDLLEVDTGRCGYLTLVQPLAQDLPAGTRLTATVAHLDLVAPEPAEAHVALAAGEAVLWERTLPIPLEATVYPLETVLAAPLPAGRRLAFHLHNHGANTWYLTDFEAHAPACP